MLMDHEENYSWVLNRQIGMKLGDAGTLYASTRRSRINQRILYGNARGLLFGHDRHQVLSIAYEAKRGACRKSRSL
jgi:hypothetical protein